jgi:hypothetical protein
MVPVSKVLELIWSEKSLAPLSIRSYSLVISETEGKLPIEMPIRPCRAGALLELLSASQSAPTPPPPTFDGCDAVDGSNGTSGAVPHWVLCQTAFGKVATKHPACGAGFWVMYASHAVELVNCGMAGVMLLVVVVVVFSFWSGTCTAGLNPAGLIAGRLST